MAQALEFPQSHFGDNQGAHCFHNCTCVMPILLLQDLETLCAVDTYIKLRLNFEKFCCEKFCL